MKQKILFIDRDGTLIKEPADEQIDSFEKLKFTEGMFRNLGFIAQKLDFQLVMVGQGPDREEIADTCTELGIADRTVFTGHLKQDTLINGL